MTRVILPQGDWQPRRSAVSPTLIAALSQIHHAAIALPDPPPSISIAWEAFVKVCEDMELVGATFCRFCDGGAGEYSHLIEHTLDCQFDAMDRAVERLRRMR